jgi:hypothetical protein
MFLNSRYFCRNSLKLSYFPEVSGFPCCLWILPWGTNFHKKRYPWYPHFFALGSLCGPQFSVGDRVWLQRILYYLLVAHRQLYPQCPSTRTIRQLAESRGIHGRVCFRGSRWQVEVERRATPSVAVGPDPSAMPIRRSTC